MAKKITKKVKEEVVEPKEPKVAEPKEVAEPKVVEKAEVPNSAPETGKFYALEVEGGAVIINPVGKRVSKVMKKDIAERDVNRMN